MSTFLKPLPAGREIGNAHETVDNYQRNSAKDDAGLNFIQARYTEVENTFVSHGSLRSVHQRDGN